jgi:hypothetical protein
MVMLYDRRAWTNLFDRISDPLRDRVCCVLIGQLGNIERAPEAHRYRTPP